MSKIKVFSLYVNDALWLTSHKQYGHNFKQVYTIADSDIVILPGGADWMPQFYGEPIGINTRPYENSDKIQMLTALEAIHKKKFIVGICRGAQGLCILNGGKLIQHVTNHAGYAHDILTCDGEILATNSLHHQMLNLSVLPASCYKTLAWSYNHRSTTYLNGKDQQCCYATGESFLDKGYNEPEIVRFNYIKGIAIQGHPEMESMPKATVTFIIDKLLEAYLDFENKSHVKHFINVPIIKSRLTHIISVLKDRFTFSKSDTEFLQLLENDLKVGKNIIDIKKEEPANVTIITHNKNNNNNETNRILSDKGKRWEY